MNAVDDTSLMEQIARAQTDALGELYERYNRLVFSVAYAIVGDRHSAEEITLDVFVQVWQHAQTYRAERARVSTWLVAITRHRAIDLLRWRKSRPEADDLEWDENGPQAHAETADPQKQAELSQQRERVRKALARLPDEQRRAVMLAYFKGYSHPQIAAALRQPLGTVKTRIRTAMQRLRQMLEDE